MEPSNKIDKLRQKAEEILRSQSLDFSIEDYKNNIAQLVEELSVYQIELELQNDELRQNQILLDIEKQKFEDLYINAPFGYFIFNKDGVIIDCNVKAGEILASNPKFLKDRPILIFLNKNNPDIFFNHLKEVFTNFDGVDKSSEITLTNKNGDVKILRLRSNIFQNKYCRTLAVDITEEILAKRNIEDLNNRLEASMSVGNMAWWELNLPSGRVEFNENKAKMLGKKVEDFQHYNDFMQLVHPDDFDGAMQAMKDHIYGKSKVYECEYRIKNAENEYLWFHDIGAIISRTEDNIKLTGIVTNITDRKNAQQLITKSERKYQSIFENSISAILLIDRAGKYLAVNPKYSKITGYNQEEVLNAPIGEITHPEDVGRIKNAIYKAIIGELNTYFDQVRIKHKNGHYIWIELNANVHRDSKGNFDYILVEFIDFTDRKNAEIELASSEMKYRILFESNMDSISVFGLENDGKLSTFFDFNENAAKIIGYSNEELAKSTPIEIEFGVSPEDLKWRSEQIQTRGFAKFETKLIHKAGNLIDVEIMATPINYNGSIGILNITRDITERKIAERAIQESEQKIRTIVRTLPDILFHFDKNGKFLSFYQENQFKLLVQPEEFLNRTVFDVFPEEFAIKIFNCIAITLNGEAVTHDYELDLDEKRYFRSRFAKLNDNEVIALVSDVTDAMKSAMIIKHQNEELVELNKTKDKFLSIIAHDLKNPFNYILLESHRLQKDLSKVSDPEEKIREIYDSAKQIYDLLENLLMWGRTQNNQIKFKPYEFDFYELALNAYLINKNNSEQKNIKVNIDVEQNSFIFADYNMINTVIRNFVSNSIKFTNPGGAVSIKFSKNSDNIEIKICDTGIGMNEIQIHNLFKIEESQSTAGTNGEVGTGLGLILCYEFIKKHNGKIHVSSMVNMGTEITVSLPNLIEK